MRVKLKKFLSLKTNGDIVRTCVLPCNLEERGAKYNGEYEHRAAEQAMGLPPTNVVIIYVHSSGLVPLISELFISRLCDMNG